MSAHISDIVYTSYIASTLLLLHGPGKELRFDGAPPSLWL